MVMDSLEKVMELVNSTQGPAEALGRVSEVTHDEPVFPATLASSGTSEVRGRWRSIVDSTKSIKILIIN